MNRVRHISMLKKSLFPLALVLCMAIVSGCGNPGTNSSADDLSVAVPAALEKAFASGTLSAQAILDGDTANPIDLTVDAANNRVTGTIPGVSLEYRLK